MDSSGIIGLAIGLFSGVVMENMNHAGTKETDFYILLQSIWILFVSFLTFALSFEILNLLVNIFNLQQEELLFFEVISFSFYIIMAYLIHHYNGPNMVKLAIHKKTRLRSLLYYVVAIASFIFVSMMTFNFLFTYKVMDNDKSTFLFEITLFSSSQNFIANKALSICLEFIIVCFAILILRNVAKLSPASIEISDDGKYVTVEK